MRRSDPMLPFGLFLAQLKLQLPRVTRKAGRLEWRGIRGGQGRLGMVAVVLSVVPDRSPCPWPKDRRAKRCEPERISDPKKQFFFSCIFRSAQRVPRSPDVS